MVADNQIRINEATKKGLDDLKQAPRETYGDTISRLVAEAIEKVGV